MLRLKLHVNKVASIANQDGEKYSEEVHMSAVCTGSDANRQWSKWTPSASLSMQISNPAAFDKLRPGMFVFCDITETDKDS